MKQTFQTQQGIYKTNETMEILTMPRIKYKEAAGLKAKKGKPALGKRPEKAELKKLYVKESKSIREIAKILDCSKDMVYRGLKEHRIERRSPTSIKKLADYPMENLVTDVQEKGIRGLARELGVTEGAIRHHLQKLDGDKKKRVRSSVA